MVPFFSRLADFQQFARTNSDAVRVKVRGTVTYQHQNRSLFAQDASAAVYAFTRTAQPLEVGDEIEIVGIATMSSTTFSPALYSSSFHKIGRGKLPAPRMVQARGVMAGRHDTELVRISGKLVSRHERENTIVLTLLSDSIPFRVEFVNELPSDPFPELDLGSVLQVTGICSIKPETTTIVRSFEVLLRSPADLRVLRTPSWWTPKRLVALMLCALIFGAGTLMWVVQLRSQVERRTLEVRALNQELETRVEARTRELHLANERLAATNRELEAFSYSVSHDLKAPLRAIGGFTRAIADEHAHQLDPDGKQLLERVESNTARMARLIDDLLLFSRAAHSTMRAGVLDMEEIFRRAYEELALSHQGQKIDFRLPSLPRAYGDLSMIKQVVTNLLSNAMKFSRARAASVIEVGCEEGADLTYFVKDNGVGFDGAQTAQAFGIFQRLHGREYEGTGVGLAIVQRIMARHGGHVSAESKPNEGAVFRFSLPRPPQSREQRSSDSLPADSAALSESTLQRQP